MRRGPAAPGGFRGEEVLVIDPSSDSWSTIAGSSGSTRWAGIAQCGDRLYCAPADISLEGTGVSAGWTRTNGLWAPLLHAERPPFESRVITGGA